MFVTGSVKVVELVTGMCYSNAPEGVSVNCLALALASGAVRLYSSWDLRPARHIPPPDAAAPAPLLRYLPPLLSISSHVTTAKCGHMCQLICLVNHSWTFFSLFSKKLLCSSILNLQLGKFK